MGVGAGIRRGRGGGGGRTHLLLALVIRPLTTHPSRDAALFLLPIETPPTFGSSLRFLHILHKNCLLMLSPSCFAVCGHHLSPRIAIVFSLLSSLPNSSMSHTSNCLISSSNAFRSSLYISHCPTMGVILSVVLQHGHIFVATSSFSPTLVYIFLLSGRSRSPTRKRSFSFFSRSPLGREDTFPFQYVPSTPRVSPSAFPLSPYFLALAFPFLLLFPLLLSCSRQTSL